MPPAKNRNHWFQVIVGDEERMFRGVGVQAEGLFAKLRRIAFDCQPIGFLVNHTHHAHDAEYLADCVHLPNGQYRATLRELRDRQIIQTLAEYRAGLVEGARTNKKTKAMLEVFDATMAGVPVSPSDEVLVIPPLISQHLGTLVGRRTGSDNAPKAVVKVLTFPDQSTFPEGVGGGGGGVGQGESSPGGPPTQISDVRYQISKSEESKPERETATSAGDGAGFELRGQPGKAPWSWEKHMFLCEQVRKLDAELQRKDPTVFDDDVRYAAHFYGLLKFDIEVFRIAQEFYQHGPNSQPVPQPCIDGHHVPYPDTNRCRYCGGDAERAEVIA